MQAPTAGNERTYALPLEAVTQAAVDAFGKAGLVTDEVGWHDTETYVINGHRESGLVRHGGEGVHVATVTVYLNRLADSAGTRVRVESSQQALPPAASSAEQRGDEARVFFSRLDAELGL